MSIYTDVVEHGLEVVRLERHPNADVALLEIQDYGVDLDVFSPFHGTTSQFELGESVVAFGYPEFTTRDRQHPTPRYFRGHIQRLFDHELHNRSYRALELNFGAPAGLSGGPVALEREPWNAIGLITENLETSTVLAKLDDVREIGHHYAERVERIVEYAVAVSLPDIGDWLEQVVHSH